MPARAGASCRASPTPLPSPSTRACRGSSMPPPAPASGAARTAAALGSRSTPPSRTGPCSGSIGPQEGFSPQVLAAAPSAPGTLYTAGLEAGVFRSTNGGASWTNIGAGLPSDRLNTLAVDPRNAAVVYAAVTNQRLYKSTDGGA